MLAIRSISCPNARSRDLLFVGQVSNLSRPCRDRLETCPTNKRSLASSLSTAAPAKRERIPGVSGGVYPRRPAAGMNPAALRNRRYFCSAVLSRRCRRRRADPRDHGLSKKAAKIAQVVRQSEVEKTRGFHEFGAVALASMGTAGPRRSLQHEAITAVGAT